MKKLIPALFAIAVFATGCESMKGGDPLVTTTGTVPLPTVTQTPVLIQWTASTSAVLQGYKLEESIDGVTFLEIGYVPYKPGVGSYGLTVPLNPGAKYYFRMRAFNEGGNSAYTSVSSVSI